MSRSSGARLPISLWIPFDIGVTVEVNPYFPLVQGNRWVYEATYEEDGEMIHEVITIEVLAETKHVDGVDCLVVRDVVTKKRPAG